MTLVLNIAGQRMVMDPQTVAGKSTRELENSFEIKKPSLWQPGRPALYELTVSAYLEGERKSSYRVPFGVKKLEVSGGRLLLNGKRLNLRGASIHEDDIKEGGALSQRTASCSSTACAISAGRSRARTIRCIRRSSRCSTGSGSSTGCTRPSTRCRTTSSDACCRRRSARRS